MDVVFREIRRGEKNFWPGTALLFVVVVTPRAVQKLLRILLTDKALSLTKYHSVEYWPGRIFNQPKTQDKIHLNQVYLSKGY